MALSYRKNQQAYILAVPLSKVLQNQVPVKLEGETAGKQRATRKSLESLWDFPPAGAARPRRVRTASASGIGMSSARTNSVAFSTASEVSPHMYTCKSSSASGSLPLRCMPKLANHDSEIVCINRFCVVRRSYRQISDRPSIQFQ